jgi:hypothetical protein
MIELPGKKTRSHGAFDCDSAPLLLNFLYLLAR